MFFGDGISVDSALQYILNALTRHGAHHISWVSVGDYAKIITKHLKILIYERPFR